MDNVPPYTGVIAKGGVTNDSSPTVSGRGDAGSIIHVLIDGREAGTVVVAANGTWSFNLPQLRDSEYRLTARASNEVGQSVPSMSYGIQIDTTPPSQPKIETVTVGTRPMVWGRAEAYSTVTVYDGKTILGTSKTNMDGTWKFSVPSDLSTGWHTLTATAMDPAGNTSVASAGRDVVIAPVVPPPPPKPVAQALLDEMGRDSGSFNFDRLTNDGTAGRLMSGHVAGALAVGEKVQVSTDGGRTWRDALMKSGGTWMAIDPNAHAGNWTIQTRLVNADGVGGPQKLYDVKLDTESPPPPVDLKIGQSQVTVGLAGKGVSVGDRINLIIDDHRVDYVLTQNDVKGGVAIIAANKGIDLTLARSIGVAIVDVSGNTSKYLTKSKFEMNFDFEDQAPRLVNPGTVLDFDGIAVKLSTNGGYDRERWPNGIIQKGFHTGEGLVTPSIGIGVWGGYWVDVHGLPLSHPTISLKNGVTATSAKFAVGELTAPLTVAYFDSSGSQILTQNYPALGGSSIFYVEATMPEGREYSTIKLIFSTNQWIWLDDISISGSNGLSYIDPPEFNNVVSNGGYFAGAADTVFTLSDVMHLAGSSGGIHGGAGTDMLKLLGKDEVLDIAALNGGVEEKISSIEVFDLTGTGNNTLKLSMKDVLELGHKDVFRPDGHTQLMVKGNAGDRVELSGMPGLDAGHWINQGMVAVKGAAYVVYENSALNVELLVQSAVTTQLV